MNLREKIAQQIKNLAENPRPSGCVELTNLNIYRIRQEDYRVLYVIDDAKLTVMVTTIGDRKEIYR